MHSHKAVTSAFFIGSVSLEAGPAPSRSHNSFSVDYVCLGKWVGGLQSAGGKVTDHIDPGHMVAQDSAHLRIIKKLMLTSIL